MKLNRFIFVLIAIVGNLILSVLLSLIAGFLSEEALDISFFKDQSLIVIFLISVVFAPIFETLVFQYVIIEGVYFLMKMNKKSFLIGIVLSSILFGLSHFYNWIYVFLATIQGISFALVYNVAKKRKDMSPFIITWVTHIFLNVFAFLMNDIFSVDFP